MALSYVIKKPKITYDETGAEELDFENANVIGVVRLCRTNGTKTDKAFLVLEGVKQSGSDLDISDTANINSMINNEFQKRGMSLSQFDVNHRFNMFIFVSNSFINKYPG